MRRYVPTTVNQGPTEATRRCSIRNRRGCVIIVEYETAATIAKYEIYIDRARHVWIQAITGKKWLLPAGTYSIEQLAP